MSEPVKKKPFQNCKPRDQWKAPVRRQRRVVEVQFGVDKEGQPDYRLVIFELKKDGLHVRRKHARKSSVYRYDKLANGVGGGQMNLL